MDSIKSFFLGAFCFFSYLYDSFIVNMYLKMFMFMWYIVSSSSRVIVINNHYYYYPLPSPTTEMDVETKTQDDVISLTTTPTAKNNCQSLPKTTTCCPQRSMFTIRCPIVLQWPFRKSPSSSCSSPTPSTSPSCSSSTPSTSPSCSPLTPSTSSIPPPSSSSTASLLQTPLPSTTPSSILPSSIFPSPPYPLPPCPSLITLHTTTLPPCTTTVNSPPSLATTDDELLYQLLWMSSATTTPPSVRIWTVTSSTSSHLTTYSAKCRSSVTRIQSTMFVPKVALKRRYNNKVLRF